MNALQRLELGEAFYKALKISLFRLELLERLRSIGV